MTMINKQKVNDHEESIEIHWSDKEQPSFVACCVVIHDGNRIGAQNVFGISRGVRSSETHCIRLPHLSISISI